MTGTIYWSRGAAWIRGEVVPIDRASIPVTDWGLTHSDIAYDVAPVWDSHADEAARLKRVLAPPLDRAYSALLEDLIDRNLLDETLVVCMGEFGRSPKINKAGGRDHWGHVFSLALAGGGIQDGRWVEIYMITQV